MKQHITVEQLNELSEKTLSNYMVVVGYTVSQEGITKKDIELLPLANIGQMIEFLDEQKKFHFISLEGVPEWVVSFGEYLREDAYFSRDKELCDALWEAVKEVLEK